MAFRARPSLVPHHAPRTSTAVARRCLHDGDVYGHQAPRTFTLPDFTADELQSRASQSNLTRLVDSYRRHGHRAARLDPLKLCAPPLRLLMERC